MQRKKGSSRLKVSLESGDGRARAPEWRWGTREALRLHPHWECSHEAPKNAPLFRINTNNN